MWLERGTQHQQPKQECPRGPHPARRRRNHERDHRGRPPQGDPHRRRDPRHRRGARPDHGQSDRQAGRAAAQVGGTARRVHLGDRVGGWARLPVRPAARRRGRARGRRAADAGRSDPRARHEAVRQERPERRALGRDRRAALDGAAARSSVPTTPSCCACCRSATTTSAGMRVQTVCRLHAALADLQPGGISKEMYASDADAAPQRLRAGERRRARAQASSPASCSTTCGASTRS